MADSTPEDLSREIDRLWARVGAVPPGPSAASSVPMTPPATAAIGAEAAWETVSILKRQQRQREATWQQTLDAREEALRLLRARLETAESELSRLRSRAEGEEERALVEALDAQAKVENAQKAVALAQARHEEERATLEAALQSLRERLAAETSRARTSEQRWQAREQQYLLDLKDLQALIGRREKETAAAEKSSRESQAGLAEAKNALERTLSELLIERKERERAHGEREAAVAKVAELRAHVDELSKIWEEERAQWRELWDRERSTWEAQRAELAQWEENLRREREAWHAELQAKEQAHLALTEDLSGKIRETSLTAEKMSGLIAGFEQSPAGAAASPFTPEGCAYAARRRRRALAAVVLAAAAALFVPAWRAATAWRFVATAESPAPTSNPAALALDGDALWIADWGGSLVAVDPADPRRVLRRAAPNPGGPYRPTAIVVHAGVLWTLDAAQGRLLRHSVAAPDAIVAARPSPGPAPAALAFDGEVLWSYDAADRAVTRHGGDDGPSQSYSLPDDAAPNAMVWVDGRLWVHDAKSKRVLVYVLKDGALVRVDSQPAPDAAVLGMAAAGTPRARSVYLLLGPSGARAAATIVRYRVDRLLPFAHF